MNSIPFKGQNVLFNDVKDNVSPHFLQNSHQLCSGEGLETLEGGQQTGPQF